MDQQAAKAAAPPTTQTPVKKSIPVPASRIPAPGAVSGIPTGLKKSATGDLKPPPPAAAVIPAAPSTPVANEASKSRVSMLQPPSSTSKLPTSASGTDLSNKEQPMKPPTSIASVPADRRVSSNDLPKSGLKAPTPVSLPTTAAVPTPSSLPTTTTTAPTDNGKSHADVDQNLLKENEQLKLKVKDLDEKLETLKLKRAEDREKLRELEKLKLQNGQLQDYKLKIQKEVSDLNKELVQTQQESKSIKEQFESYKEEMNNVEQRIEEVTVDKELAEAKIEEQQDEINRLNDKVEELQLELDVLKGEIEVNGTSGASESFALKQAEKEQERLKGALIKLRDLNLQDKADLGTLRKQNEEYLGKMTKLTKESESLKSENAAFMNQIVELKDQVTATLGSVQMIEELTEQNLNLEAKIEELETQVADLESINEVDNQLIESAKEEERELRESIDLAESRIRDYERQIESLKYNIADHEKTILKFREVVKQLQVENDKLNRQYQTKLEDEKQISVSMQQSSNYDFKTKFIETKNYAKIIENEINKIEISSLRKNVNYLLTYMNEQFLKRGGDNECILTLLLFKRLISKCELVSKEVKEKFPTVERIAKEDVFKTNKAEQNGFSFEISMLLSFAQLLSARFDSALSVCNATQYSNIGSMYFDFNVQEKALDNLIDLLQRNQLDESTSLEALEKLCLHLNAVYKNHLNDEKYDNCSLINDLVRFASHSSELIALEIQRLQFLTQAKDNDTSEIVVLFKEVFNMNDEIRNSIKTLNRVMPKDEKKQIVLNQERLTQVDLLIKHLFRMAKFLHLMSKEAANVIYVFSSDANKEEGLPAKKLEDLAYQVCDKVYSNDDSGPYENIRNSLQESNSILTRLTSSIENGEFDKQLNEEELKIHAPVVFASESFKNTLIEAESIKYKLEAKEEEVKELKKHLKFKNDELSENKVRLSLMEKKYENAQKEGEEKSSKLQQSVEDFKALIAKNEKEHSDTLEALQQELDALQNEKRDLKEKLRQFTKRNLLEGIITRQSSEPRSPSSSDPLSLSGRNNFESPALVEEIKLLKNTIRLLEDRNAELRIENAKALLSNLPNFEKAKKTQTTEKNEELNNVCKQSNQLLQELYSSLASIQIPEINGNANRKLALDLQTSLQMNNVGKRCSELEKKLTQLQSNLIPGSCVKTPLNTYQTPEFNNKASPILIAEIAIPCAKGKEKQIDLFLNNKDIKEIFKTISSA